MLRPLLCWEADVVVITECSGALIGVCCAIVANMMMMAGICCVDVCCWIRVRVSVLPVRVRVCVLSCD